MRDFTSSNFWRKVCCQLSAVCKHSAGHVLLWQGRGTGCTFASTGDDTWIIIASDGLFENEVRGGGGGLDNQEVVDMCLKSKDSTSAKQLARELVEAAQEVGTTDDVTVAVLRIAV
jgi:hypothetical protein